MNDFFAFMNRMKYIRRWSLMRSTVAENIMEHSEQVAMLAHALATIKNEFFGGNVNADRAAVLGIFHEASEVITGDLPTPIKYYNKELNTAYKDLEGVANEKLLGMLPTEMQNLYGSLIEPEKTSEEYIIVKAADKLAAYVKCVEELKVGNKEFAKAEKTIKKALSDMKLPELDYFMTNFLPAFSKTLDETEF